MIERILIGEHVEKQIPHLEERIGYLRMTREIRTLGNESANLTLNTSRSHPLFTAVSSVQGEKGYHLLKRVQKALSRPFDNPNKFTYFLSHYVHDYAKNRASLDEFELLIREETRKNFFFLEALILRTKISAHSFVVSEGIPQSEVSFDLPIFSQIQEIANGYFANGGKASPPTHTNLRNFSAKAKVLFVEELLSRSSELTLSTVANIHGDYFISCLETMKSSRPCGSKFASKPDTTMFAASGRSLQTATWSTSDPCTEHSKKLDTQQTP